MNGAPTGWKAHAELACGAATPPESGVNRVGSGMVKPELVYKVEPQYSEAARAARLSGDITLYLVVDTTGHATDISVLRGLGAGLDKNA